jgi:hypothetical protein
MTYHQLIEQLWHSLTPNQLDQTVTVLCADEYLTVNQIGVAVDDDVLDTDQIVLNTGGE